MHEGQLDILLTWRGRIGLFKKSGRCSSGNMPWQLLSVDQTSSCSTLDDGLLPCMQLLHQGTGLAVRDILAVRSCPTVELSDGSKRTAHFVYVVETNQRRLALGQEYSTYRWVKRPRVGRFDGGVHWLAPVLEAVAPRPPKPGRADIGSEEESPMTRTGVPAGNPGSGLWTSKAPVPVPATVFGKPPRILAGV